jgi:spermidine synthase
MSLIFSKHSRYQRISLYGDDEPLRLTLNDGIQFHAEDERANHERLASLPLALSGEARRVLILGGGDGLAAREALRFPETRVDLVELDEEMIRMTRSVPEMIAITENALNQERLHVHLADAFAWIESSRDRYDVIINDVDFLETPQEERIGLERFLAYIRGQIELLAPLGVVSIYAPIDEDGADFFDCAEDAVVQEFERALSPLFTRLLTTTLDSPHLGPHVFGCGVAQTKDLRVRRDVPVRCSHVSRELVERLLRG